MTGSVPVDWQLTDTYFIVAHLHYVLIGINVFPVMGATHFWFPKMTGKLMDEKLGRWNFWTLFTGFNLGFFPMHISGLLGMPRHKKSHTYGDGKVGRNWLNLVTPAASILFGLGVLLFIYNVWSSLRRGPAAGDNPWDAPTLEWATSSPPPPYNFAVLPRVASRHPLWEDRLSGTARSVIASGPVLEQGREALGTTPLDAESNVILKMPGDTLVPLLLALAMTVLTAGLALVNWPVVGLGVVLIAAAILAWLWPQASLGETAEVDRDG